LAKARAPQLPLCGSKLRIHQGHHDCHRAPEWGEQDLTPHAVLPSGIGRVSHATLRGKPMIV
jgi:hypothetical protein